MKVGVFGDWNLGGQAIQQSAAIFDLLIADVNGADRLRALGFDRVVSTPLWSFDPDLHRRIPNVTRDIDILLVGNFNHEIQRERSRWLGRVARLSSQFKVLLAAGIYGEEYAHLLNRAKIVFNRSIRGELNMRAYEAPACGAMLFYERENREIGSLFGDCRECVLYGEDDMEALAAYYLRHEDERAAIAEAGWTRVQSESPARHMEDMFRILDRELNAQSGLRPPAFRALPESERELRRARQWLLSADLGCLGAADAALQRAEQAEAKPGVVAGVRGYLLAQAGQHIPQIDRAQAWTEAIQHWRIAVEIEPNDAASHLNLSSLYMENAAPASAEAHARTALDLLSGANPPAIAPGALFWPCRYTSFGVEYDRIEISNGHNSDKWAAQMRDLLIWRACELLTDLAFAADRFANSLDYAREAVARMPHIAATQFRLGRALNALGNLDEAVPAYKAALGINPFLGEARSALAQALIDSGRPSAALAVLEDWSAIINGCPAYSHELNVCDRLRVLAQSAVRSGTPGPPEHKRALAFPDWRLPAGWKDLIAAMVRPPQSGPAAGREVDRRLAFAAGRDTDEFPPISPIHATGSLVSTEGALLMLWADPALYEPAALLREIAAYLTGCLKLSPSNFPDVTIVSQTFAPNERWKLFHAANFVVDAGPMPEQFRDVFEACSLPVLSIDDICRRAA